MFVKHISVPIANPTTIDRAVNCECIPSRFIFMSGALTHTRRRKLLEHNLRNADAQDKCVPMLMRRWHHVYLILASPSSVDSAPIYFPHERKSSACSGMTKRRHILRTKNSASRNKVQGHDLGNGTSNVDVLERYIAHSYCCSVARC